MCVQLESCFVCVSCVAVLLSGDKWQILTKTVQVSSGVKQNGKTDILLIRLASI